MLKAILLTLALVAVSLSSFAEARAQSDEKKFEVGGQFSILQVPTRTAATFTVPTSSEKHATEYGLGGRIGYNFSKNFALEAEGNFFPRDRDLQGGRKIQGLFGVKAGRNSIRLAYLPKRGPVSFALKEVTIGLDRSLASRFSRRRLGVSNL